MQINIKGTNVDLIPEIKDYINKKIGSLEKLFPEDDHDAVKALFEIARKGGQKSGDVFHADCLIERHSEKFYASADKPDIHQAVDEVRDTLFREIRRSKNKKWAVFYRGARKVKDMMRSAKNYRPWRK